MKHQILELSNKLVKEALKKGFQEAAVKIYTGRSVMLKIVNSEISIVQHWNINSVGIYLTKNEKIIVIESEPSRIEDVVKILENTTLIADKIAKSEIYQPLPEPSKVEPLEDLVDRKIIELMDSPEAIAERILEVAHREKIDSIAGMIRLSYGGKSLVTSKDVELFEEKTSIDGYIRCFSDSGSGQWGLGLTHYDVGKIEETTLTAVRLALESKNPYPAEPGVYDVILSPMVVGNLLDVIGYMSSGYAVLMGMSIFMKNKPGDKVASEILSIKDTPREPMLPGATAFDDEGVPTRDKNIIEGGKLVTLLHNTKTAAKMGARTTGNAGWISPHPWNLEIQCGDYSLEEMISEIDRGILVTNNWYTRMQNYVEGIFSTITRDALFEIESGRIKGALKKLRLSDKLPRMLNNVTAIGREQYYIMWWEVETPVKVPYILVKSVRTSKHLI